MSLGWALVWADLAAGFWRVFLVKPCVFAVRLTV
jgi:hypothetical protein